MSCFGIIYKAENKVNGKVYIGQTTVGLVYRMNCHFSETVAERYVSHFHNAIKKHGKNNFTWEIIEHCESKEELDEMEYHYIKQYNSFEGGYNLTLGGDGQLGFKHSEETKATLSNIQSGEKNSFYGRKHSKKTIEKIRTAVTGKLHTEEHKKKITGKGNPFYGMKHTKKVRDKIARKNKERVWSALSRKRLSDSLKKSWAKRKNNKVSGENN